MCLVSKRPNARHRNLIPGELFSEKSSRLLYPILFGNNRKACDDIPSALATTSFQLVAADDCSRQLLGVHHSARYHHTAISDVMDGGRQADGPRLQSLPPTLLVFSPLFFALSFPSGECGCVWLWLDRIGEGTDRTFAKLLLIKR